MNDWVGQSLFGAENETIAELVNLTPHPISVTTASGSISIAPSGNIARVNVSEQPSGESVNGTPIKVRITGEAQGIPSSKDGVYYIVSSMVLSAVTGRPDVIAPDTGKEALRDDKGNIVSVKSFVRNGR